jgi:hypothetical protein
MIATAPLLAERVIVVREPRSHYYSLPTFVTAEVIRVEGEKIVVRTTDGVELSRASSAVFCPNFPEDIEKTQAFFEEFQQALSSQASGLQALMRYDKALAESPSPRNPLTPTIVAAEDPESGIGIDPKTWQPLTTDQEDWFYLPVERIEVARHMEGHGLIPKDPTIPPIHFENAFVCESDEEWEMIKALSEEVIHAQKRLLGHLKLLETYYSRSVQNVVEAEVVETEIVEEEDLSPSSESGGLAVAIPPKLKPTQEDENWVQGILLELELANREEVDEEQEKKALIPEDKEDDCAAIIGFLAMSGRKYDQGLWYLKYQILEDRRSSRFGDFENICKRLHEMEVLPFKPNNARNYALGYEERRQLEAAKIIEPGHHISIAALIEMRQIRDIEDKRAAVNEILASGQPLTEKLIKQYRTGGGTREPSSGSRPSVSRPSATPATPLTTTSLSRNTQAPLAPTDSPASNFVSINPKEEIGEGDLVETLPGAKYIGSSKEIPVGTKGVVQNVGKPAKQCMFIHKENPENMGFVLLEYLKKIPIQFQDYSQIVDETSQQVRSEKLVEDYQLRDTEKDRQIKELQEKLQEAEAINKDLKWRFTEMAKDPTDTRAKVLAEVSSILQRYEDEYGITELYPDVKNCFADIWDALKKAVFDPIEDKALN